MTTEPRIKLRVELADSEQAWRLAHFIKRVGFYTLYEYTEGHLPPAERERRAYLMTGGLAKIEDALTEAGIAP